MEPNTDNIPPPSQPLASAATPSSTTEDNSLLNRIIAILCCLASIALFLYIYLNPVSGGDTRVLKVLFALCLALFLGNTPGAINFKGPLWGLEWSAWGGIAGAILGMLIGLWGIRDDSAHTEQSLPPLRFFIPIEGDAQAKGGDIKNISLSYDKNRYVKDGSIQLIEYHDPKTEYILDTDHSVCREVVRIPPQTGHIFVSDEVMSSIDCSVKEVHEEEDNVPGRVRIKVTDTRGRKNYDKIIEIPIKLKPIEPKPKQVQTSPLQTSDKAKKSP